MARSVSIGEVDLTGLPSSHQVPVASKPLWREMTKSERLALAWYYYREGVSVTEIAEYINRELAPPSPLNRGSVYDMFRRAAKADLLQLVPKAGVALTARLHRACPWLAEVDVTQTTHFEDIARRGAKMLIGSLQQEPWAQQEEVHIGLAGGHAMRRLMQVFAEMLSEADEPLPRRLVFHALVAGFDILEPTTDPNTFFTLFEDPDKFATEFRFIGLPSPPCVQADQYETLRHADWFEDCYRYAQDLDIILTSGAAWSDEHSSFRRSMKRSESTFQALDRSGCAGDLLWRPLGQQGPLDIPTDIRSMTLLELSELAAHVERGKHVYLVLGPCAGCGNVKSDLLSAVLASRPRLISHLICDSRTASGALSAG